MQCIKGNAKIFVFGWLCGVITAAVLIFGSAAISVLRNGKTMTMPPGYAGTLKVDVTQSPWDGYDWSLDISRHGNYLARIGKLTESDDADRCQIFDPQGNLLLYMVWDDPEASPGLSLFNGKTIIAALSIKAEGSERVFTYGPYRRLHGKLAGDIDYQDLDFDGRFDIKTIHGGDSCREQAFIWVDDGWQDVYEFNLSVFAALVTEGEKMRSYVFRKGQGWHLQSQCVGAEMTD